MGKENGKIFIEITIPDEGYDEVDPEIILNDFIRTAEDWSDWQYRIIQQPPLSAEVRGCIEDLKLYCNYCNSVALSPTGCQDCVLYSLYTRLRTLLNSETEEGK